VRTTTRAALVAALAALSQVGGKPAGTPRQEAGVQPPTLPQGRVGLAARHPGDVGLEEEEAVVFVERFDAETIEEVAARWESVAQPELLSLSEDTPPHSADARSLLVTHVGGESTGAHLYRRLEPGHATLHYRFLVKFDEGCAPIHHFFHVGGYAPPTPWPQGGAGERPSGAERFSTGVEPFGDRWRWDYYSYWSEMRGSPPKGQTWGNSFVHDPELVAERGRWTCVELRMELNHVGRSNGAMALWIDGALVSHIGEGFPSGKWSYDKFLPGEGGAGVRWSDEQAGPEPLEFPEGGAPFEGFRWRDDEALDLNFLWLLVYITKAPEGHVSRVRLDNVVVATEYIGPIEPAEPDAPEAPR